MGQWGEASPRSTTRAAHFDPAKFKDRYETALKALVKRKAAGKKIEPAEPPAKPSKIVNLMEALKQSLSHGKKQPVSSAKRAAKAPKHARAPSIGAQHSQRTHGWMGFDQDRSYPPSN